MISLSKFKNLFDLLTYFKDEAVCREYLANTRWADGKVICPKCQCDKVYKCAKRYSCTGCKRMFSVTVGTIFEQSHIPLQKWFAAIYLISAHKKGISSHQLKRDIGVTQKTAWYMNHRVRFSLGLTNPEQLEGIVEADETFIGGKEKNKHKNKQIDNAQGRSVKGKTPVAGVLQRGGKLRAKQLPDTRGYNLRPFVIENVAFGATLKTDEYGGYNGLNQVYKHQRVAHMEGVYVDGDTHTNGMEGFWAILKRGIYGIYHHVSDEHLQAYVNEFVFRYNSRKSTETERFDFLFNNLGKHLLYKKLINATTRVSSEIQPEQNLFS